MVEDHTEAVDAPADDARLDLHDVFRTSAERETELTRLRRVRAATLASVSHELRTPLTVIGATAETVLEHTDDPLVQRLMRSQRNATLRLAALVDEILSVTTLLATDDRADDQRIVSLTEMVAVATDALASSGEAIEVTTDIATGAERLRTLPAILQTLLRCVIEDRWRSGDGAPVRVAASVGADCVSLSVRSTRPLVLDSSVDAYSPHGGAGLSVTAAALLAERLGGELMVGDDAAQMVLVTLPQRREDDPIPHV